VRLYHYVPFRYGLQNIERKRLKIAEFSDLNDPFELLGCELPTKNHRALFKSWKRTVAARFGLLCFSRTWQNPVMWSHYAEKHQGVCLGFDVADHLLMPVIYSERRLELTNVKPFQELVYTEELMRHLLSTKSAGWSYE
jgi:hypothetical protein